MTAYDERRALATELIQRFYSQVWNVLRAQLTATEPGGHQVVGETCPSPLPDRPPTYWRAWNPCSSTAPPPASPRSP
jgi:hypothetical protein